MTETNDVKMSEISLKPCTEQDWKRKDVLIVNMINVEKQDELLLMPFIEEMYKNVKHDSRQEMKTWAANYYVTIVGKTSRFAELAGHCHKFKDIIIDSNKTQAHSVSYSKTSLKDSTIGCHVFNSIHKIWQEMKEPNVAFFLYVMLLRNRGVIRSYPWDAMDVKTFVTEQIKSAHEMNFYQTRQKERIEQNAKFEEIE